MRRDVKHASAAVLLQMFPKRLEIDCRTARGTTQFDRIGTTCAISGTRPAAISSAIRVVRTR
jgi:hypothetical protein